MDRYAVIGNPVAHSKSPDIHAAFAQQTGELLTYSTLVAPLDGFVPVVTEFFRSGGKGLNVTIPFKVEACDLSQRLTERAQAAGAVNTLSSDGREICGDNTDGVGLVRDIIKNFGFVIADRRVLLIGAGGAARGVLLPLLLEKPASITIANRTVSRANELLQRFSGRGPLAAVGFDALQGRVFDVIINATAASLGNDIPPVPAEAFAKGALAYDMMYGKGEAPFLQFAREAGAHAVDGLGMLVEQAAESFLVWRGVRPDTAPVLKQLRSS